MAVIVMINIMVIITGIIFFKTCTHEVTHKGVVISHHTTSDRYGNIEYYTVATFDDGYLRSIHGLEYYIVEVGGTIYYTKTELNK
jgi:hypothetical protein